MSQPQYNHKCEQLIDSIPEAKKHKGRGYGKASFGVVRFLRSAGVLPPGRDCLPVSEICSAIVGYKRERPLVMTRDQARRLVLGFYQEISNDPRTASPKQIVIASRSKADKIRARSLEYALGKRGKSVPREKSQSLHGPVKVVQTSKDFYWSDAWRTLRYSALRECRGVCELCGASPSPGHPLHVDHIKPRSRFPELELDPANLQVLCDDCNLGKGNTDSIDWRIKAG